VVYHGNIFELFHRDTSKEYETVARMKKERNSRQIVHLDSCNET